MCKERQLLEQWKLICKVWDLVPCDIGEGRQQYVHPPGNMAWLRTFFGVFCIHLKKTIKVKVSSIITVLSSLNNISLQHGSDGMVARVKGDGGMENDRTLIRGAV